MITRKRLHELEMDLVNLCEDNDIMREAIINIFTNLISEVEKMRECKYCGNKTGECVCYFENGEVEK